jgi:hypothetical protein
MNKCNQSKAEKEWLKLMEWEGYDKLSVNRSFGLIKDKEGVVFSHIPDAAVIHKRTLDLYIFDHKVSELNGTMCKRTAIANKQKQVMRGNKGASFKASWSNSFYQKDLIQQAFKDMVICNVYYIIVTKKPIQIKKTWRKKNPFVLNLTEGEVLLLKEDVREIEVFDSRLSSHQMDGVGGLITNLPEVDNEQAEFKAVTASGLVTLNASKLVRSGIASLRARLIV